MQETPEAIAKLMAENEALKKELSRMQFLESRCIQTEKNLRNLEEEIRLMGENTPLGIFSLDLEGDLLGANRKMLELCPELARNGKSPLNLIKSPPFASSALVTDIQDCMSQHKSRIVEHLHPVSDREEPMYLRYYLSPIPAGANLQGGVIAFVEDVTDFRKASENLRDSERRYRRLFQSAPIALVEWDVSQLKVYLERLRESGITDFKGYLDTHPEEIPHCWALIHTLDFNESFLELMGVKETGGPSDTFLPIESMDVLAVAREIILLAAEGKAAVEREATITTTSGEKKVVLGKSLAMSGHEETLARVAIAVVDISERKKAESELKESERRFREQAFKDGLTGLYNQRYLFSSLSSWIERSRLEDFPVSVIFMDLDHFKQVVDTYGHLNGSRAIREVGEVIAMCLEEPAYAVAYAGDEFVMILPEMDSAMAMAKAREIHAKINETAFTLDQGIEIHLHASFGVATFPDHATDLKSLIAAADQTLFQVKARGKNMIALYGQENPKK